MINAWGGWTLFQELLTTLSTISKKYNVSISTVATRWVLDHDYVGAVIVGARMGISEHIEENRRVFRFRFDGDDLVTLEKVLARCRAREMMAAMGDCGGEYRS
jgi:aryl-alcohol dehydrogenase-like predicted oxidoreductase